MHPLEQHGMSKTGIGVRLYRAPLGLIVAAIITTTALTLLGVTTMLWLAVGLLASLAVVGSP